MKKALFWVFLAGLMFLPAAGSLAGPGGSNHPQASWETLADGSKVYGFWQDSGGYRFLVECDPATGQLTGFAYLNSGKYVEQEVQVLDGYDEEYFIDYSQPKRYLYPIEILYGRYREQMLPIRYALQDPLRVAYPYGATIAEDWRPVLILLINPNAWTVKAGVTAVMDDGDRWSGEVVFAPYEWKYVMLKIPAGAKATGKDAYETSYIYVDTKITENLDPLSPPNYKYNPRADDGRVVSMYADLVGVQFGSPEDYDEVDIQKAFALRPAFKEVMRWVPEDPANWRVGRPEYDLVPGYRWDVVRVYGLTTEAGDPLPVVATQEDIENLRAVGPLKDENGNEVYYKTEGVTATLLKKEKVGRHDYIYYFKARIPVKNNTGFIAWFDNLRIVTRQYINGEYRKVRMPGSASGGPAPPGETIELYAEFTQDSREEERIWKPRVVAGSVFNGIGGIYYPEILRASVTINAVAGCEDYNDERHWSGEFYPYLPITLFDFEEVMTPEELATFARYVDTGIRDNITYFLAGQPELMRVSATYDRYEAIFDDD
ncbi:MAG: hypothetical protein ACPLQP_06395 [Moorellaceae bacterium]